MTAKPDVENLPPGALAKEDEGDDADFYAMPRLVTHIDDGAIELLKAFYRRTLPAGGVLLDLMSSWVSHLPEEIVYRSVVGHGLNPQELAANPRLTRWFLQDLNRNTVLPMGDGATDAAMICVGVQYLQQPITVLEEVRRVLKPGSPLVISFSNRCFPTKAVAVWRALDGHGHARLIDFYLRGAGFDKVETHILESGARGDPMTVVVGRS